MARKLIYIAGGIIILLVLAVLILPFFIDANTFRPQIESAAESALNRKVTIGTIHLSLFSGSVSIDDLSVSDDPAFSSSPFLTARSVAVGVKLLPLIFSRHLHVTGITIDQPHITLMRAPSGAWNFANLGEQSSSSKPAAVDSGPAAPASNTPQNVYVQKIQITNGTVSVGKTASGKRSEYTGVDFEASNFSYTAQFPFTLAVKTPGNGTLKLEGKAGPINQSNVVTTPVHASLEIDDFDLAATGFIDSASGIAGLLDFKGTLTSDGGVLSSKGTIRATKWKLVPSASPAGQPLQIDYDADYQMQPETGVVKQGDLKIGRAVAHVTGTFDNSGEEVSVQMKLNGENMPATDLQAILPAVDMSLPYGASLRQGAVSVALSIAGPMNHLVTVGPVKLSNAKLSGFDLGGELGALSSFAGIPRASDTLIKTLSSDVRITPEGIRAKNLNLVVPAIGSLTGNGTVAANQALDFKMVAHLTRSNTPIGQLAGLIPLGRGQKGTAVAIPFMIKGTASKPVFVPDVGGIANQMGVIPPGDQGLVNELGGLIGGNKKKKKKHQP